MSHLLLRLLRSQPLAMFCCLGTASVHHTLEPQTGLASLASQMSLILLPASLTLWLQADAHRRGLSLPHDAGFFLFLTWPLVVPIYCLATRGWRGLLPVGGFLLLYLASIGLGWLLRWSGSGS